MFADGPILTKTPPIHDPSQEVRQLASRVGFDQVIVHSKLLCLASVLLHIAAGEEQEGNPGQIALPLGPTEQLQASLLGHLEVRKDYRWQRRAAVRLVSRGKTAKVGLGF